MKGSIHSTTVSGKKYTFWSDFIARATYAEDENGTVKMISGGSYIRNDLTARKAIASAFGLDSFKK